MRTNPSDELPKGLIEESIPKFIYGPSELPIRAFLSQAELKRSFMDQWKHLEPCRRSRLAHGTSFCIPKTDRKSLKR